ncbi:CRISPR-associated endoribonuclease Cas6 [Streptococcus dentapri]|uniref:CRISPR-associated endoribonuclease Cas6 n=1 Tax=Streptococcus dentapri TaxID=573564 RepID=A0ABV8CZU4_9STRE
MKQITISFKKTSLSSEELAVKFQGFLLSQLPKEDGEQLHRLETNPYSLMVQTVGEQQFWTVNLLTDDMCDKLQNRLLSLETIQLDSYEKLIEIEKIEVKSLSTKQLVEMFNADCDQATFTIRFVSPTSFKSAGQYVIFPTVKLIFQSFMQKYGRLFPDISTFDENLLNYLVEHSKITSYQLQTRYFAVHRNKIPAFKGKLTIKVYGASTLKAFVKLMIAFSEFSGVGIKTSMGMGGVRIEERKN